jgi:hypothetical protein
MESPAIEGDRPVSETAKSLWMAHPSTVGHEESCGNLGGPPPKAKHYPATDSEPVPRGKGEKNPFEGSEIVPEIACLQAVGALCSRASAREQGNLVPFA